MNRILLSFCITNLLFSCINSNTTADKHLEKNKTAIELEDESVKFNKHNDTIRHGYYFGMTKNDVEELNKKQILSDEVAYTGDGRIYYRFETKNFIIKNVVDFFYDNNGRLFRVSDIALENLIEPKNKSNANFKEEVLNDTKRNFGSKPLKNGTQSKAICYWLKGNLRVDYYEEKDASYVFYSDITAERKILANNKKVGAKIQKLKQLENEMINNKLRNEELNIIQLLKSKAKKDWPEDYITQEYWITEQIDAYHYMQIISNEDRIKKKAQRDWPLDFVTQKYWYNEQIEAKERLNN